MEQNCNQCAHQLSEGQSVARAGSEKWRVQKYLSKFAVSYSLHSSRSTIQSHPVQAKIISTLFVRASSCWPSKICAKLNRNYTQAHIRSQKFNCELNKSRISMEYIFRFHLQMWFRCAGMCGRHRSRSEWANSYELFNVHRERVCGYEWNGFNRIGI